MLKKAKHIQVGAYEDKVGFTVTYHDGQKEHFLFSPKVAIQTQPTRSTDFLRAPVSRCHEGDEDQSAKRTLSGSDGPQGKSPSHSGTSRASRYSSYTSRQRSGSV